MAKAKPQAETIDHKAAILDWLLTGESLRAYCRQAGAPSIFTVLRWISDDKDFEQQYARAREMAQEVAADALDDIGDDAVKAETAVEVAGLRLKADIVKWKMARMAPKKYGDKVQAELSGTVNMTLYDGEQAARMASLLNAHPA
jgi:hypothetical protein